MVCVGNLLVAKSDTFTGRDSGALSNAAEGSAFGVLSSCPHATRNAKKTVVATRRS